MRKEMVKKQQTRQQYSNPDIKNAKSSVFVFPWENKIKVRFDI